MIDYSDFEKVDIQIIPSIIPSSLEELSAQAGIVRRIVPLVQIDISDAIFSPTLTWPLNTIGKKEFASIVAESEGLPFWDDMNYEVDLLVANPAAHIEGWIRAGVSRAVIHVESGGDLKKVCDDLEDAFIEVTLGINPSTDNNLLEPLITSARSIQCMGNDTIGFHGVELDPAVIGKIGDLRTLYPETIISVDIGVNQETIGDLYRAGARRFIAGSAVYKSGDSAHAIEELTRAALEQQ